MYILDIFIRVYIPVVGFTTTLVIVIGASIFGICYFKKRATVASDEIMAEVGKLRADLLEREERDRRLFSIEHPDGEGPDGAGPSGVTTEVSS